MTLPEAIIRQAILDLEEGDFVQNEGDFDIYRARILESEFFIAIKLIPNKPLFIGSVKSTLDEVLADLKKPESLKN